MSNFASSKSFPKNARRRLGFSRLEKRYMLSGDFGELFETDDDDLDFDDLFDVFSESDDDDFEFEDRFEFEDSDHSADFLNPNGTASIANINEIFSQVESENEESEPIGSDNAQEDSEEPREGERIEVEFSQGETPSQIESLQSDLEVSATQGSESGVITFRGVTTSTQIHRDIQNEEGFDSTSAGSVLHLVDDALTHRAIPHVTNPASEFVEVEQYAQATSLLPAQTADITFPQAAQDQLAGEIVAELEKKLSEQPVDEVTAAVMPWIGSIADDLAAFDDAFHEFVSGAQSLTEESFASFVRPSAGQAAFLTIAGIAVVREVAVRQRRKLERELKDEVHAGKFDARLYPELFG